MKKSPPHPDGFKIVRKTLSDGTIKEYRYPRSTKATSRAPSVGTIGAVLRLYYQSPEWRSTKLSSQRSRILYLKELERIEQVPIRELRRRVILQFRDAIAAGRGTGAANQFIQASSAFLSWALNREWVDANAAARIGMLPYTPLPAWTKEMARDAIRNLPAHLSRAVMLALFTGQRRSDLCAMRWSDIQNGAIFVRQIKTGTELWVPIHPVLAQAMAQWPKTCNHILTGVRGGPLTTHNITRSMNEAQARRIIPTGFNMHGLRKLAATLLAEAGCSTHEIAAITGHKTLKMVEHYTRSADQRRMAAEAISRAETSFWKPEETAMQPIENKRTPLLNQ
ncbi:tyrosine-type recombinase/integrase [Gluconobacter sphaericus]|uniref:tyrosine-type recombinase/integrase n=1 Tax=Gluconobacter sphaericus TaxID=574987 RepID=UPI0019207CCB|nr:tyrosine-type recombinase/integrase [Gluconobacter sphaericus]QQX91304.1 tyrosine-type recombinase/integrase [Gluconobacter sphaericus]